MMSKNRNIFQKIPNILFFALLGYAFYYFSKKEGRLVQYYKIAIGKVYDYKEYGIRSSGGILYYTFNAKDSTVKGSNSDCNIATRNLKYFVGRQFYVIYDSTDISNNKMLITPENFRMYDMQFPDSLNWVTEYE